jgi:hypothetical protein
MIICIICLWFANFSSFINRTRESTALPIRRLWCYLVRQEKVQDIFIRLVFGKKHITYSTGANNAADSVSVYSDPTGQGIYCYFHTD